MDWQAVAFATFLLLFVAGWSAALTLFAIAIRRGYRFKK